MNANEPLWLRSLAPPLPAKRHKRAWELVPALALGVTFLLGCLGGLHAAEATADGRFAKLAARFLEASPAFSPVGATQLGDHRFDHLLDQVTPEARASEINFCRQMEHELGGIPRAELSRANQVDAALLEHDLAARLWHLEVFQDWAWNPLHYTGLSGGAIYSLMAREFAPLPERLRHVTDRLEQIPRLLEQVRATLVPARVPPVHAETAVKQNPGLLSIIDDMVKPNLEQLPGDQRERLVKAIETTRAAAKRHQQWLEDLVPRAKGDFRIGAKLFDQRLALSLHASLNRAEVRERAERELKRGREEMYRAAREVYAKEYPYTRFPETPDESYRQAIIRAALEVACRQLPGREEIVPVAKRQLEQATAFVREKNLVSVPPDPVEVIIMPEFQRGVSVAYCDSPGALDAGQKTFYAVSPLPKDWSSEQVRSFLREYNPYSMQDLTIHEAMPGHYLQLAHANRYPSKLRAVLGAGTFVEGWAVYAEKLLVDEGYLSHDPLMRLTNLKWYLRGVANAIIDQAIHCENMSREDAMKLMIEGTFQEEREAALKWVRAQLTSTQLSTYFVGYQEHADLRREVERVWGHEFTLKKYHDQLLSYGSPPVRFARALMLNQPITP